MCTSLPHTVKLFESEGRQLYVFTYVPNTMPKTQLKPINSTSSFKTWEKKNPKQENICLAWLEKLLAYTATIFFLKLK